MHETYIKNPDILDSQLVGKSIANDILVRGKKFNARQAKEWRFVNDVLPQDEVLTKTIAIAKELASQPIGALFKAKAVSRRYNDNQNVMKGND